MSRRATTIAALLIGSLAACGGAQVEPAPAPAAPPPADAPGDAPADPPGAPVEARLTVSPQTGETGTQVTLHAHGLSPGATITIGFGPPQSEYETLETRPADSDGSLRTTARVPAWAEADRVYVFVADGPNSLAVADFQVTAAEDPPERAEVTGMLTDEGVECPALRSDGGELYTLAGDTGDFSVGDRVTVEGTIAEVSSCMQGTTIRVERIRAGGDR